MDRHQVIHVAAVRGASGQGEGEAAVELVVPCGGVLTGEPH